MALIRIILCDDHAVVRDGLAALIDAEPDMKVVGSVADGESCLAMLGDTMCDVLILDLSLPVLSGAEVIKRLAQSWPGLRILVLTMQPEDRYTAHLLRLGASGYITKGRPSAEVIEAVRTVALGHRYLGPRGLDQLLGAPPASAGQAPHQALSPREQEVLRLLAQGKRPKEISKLLAVSSSTVSTYVSRIKDKLDAGSLGDLIAYVHRHRLLD